MLLRVVFSFIGIPRISEGLKRKGLIYMICCKKTSTQPKHLTKQQMMQGQSFTTSHSHHLPRADWCPPFLWAMATSRNTPWLAPTVLFLRTISYNMGYPFGQLGSVLCRHCSAIVKTLVCYQHTFVHESKPWHLMGCYEGTSSQPDSLHCTNIFKRYFRFSCSYFEVQRWMRPPL